MLYEIIDKTPWEELENSWMNLIDKTNDLALNYVNWVYSNLGFQTTESLSAQEYYIIGASTLLASTITYHMLFKPARRFYKGIGGSQKTK